MLCLWQLCQVGIVGSDYPSCPPAPFFLSSLEHVLWVVVQITVRRSGAPQTECNECCVCAVVTSKSICSHKCRWEDSADTCPVSPPTVRPSFHCCAPIALLGSPWQQCNDDGSQKINRWRAHYRENVRATSCTCFCYSEREQNESCGPH